MTLYLDNSSWKWGAQQHPCSAGTLGHVPTATAAMKQKSHNNKSISHPPWCFPSRRWVNSHEILTSHSKYQLGIWSNSQLCSIRVPVSCGLSIRATKCGIYFGVIRFHSLRQFSSKIIKEISNQRYFGEKKIKGIVEIYTDPAPEDIPW